MDDASFFFARNRNECGLYRRRNQMEREREKKQWNKIARKRKANKEMLLKCTWQVVCFSQTSISYMQTHSYRCEPRCCRATVPMQKGKINSSDNIKTKWQAENGTRTFIAFGAHSLLFHSYNNFASTQFADVRFLHSASLMNVSID